MIKVMVIGAGIYQLPLIKYAASCADVLVAAPEISDEIKAMAYKTCYTDVRDKDKILEFAKSEKIDAVITDQTDIPVETVAYVAEKLGLPGNDPEVIALFTDKFKMREKCKELNIPVVEYKLVRDKEEAVEFFRSLGRTVIIKPVDNQGSRGIAKIETEEQLSESFDRAKSCSKSGCVLIERYIVGREFVAEGMAVDHKFKNLICGDTLYFKSVKSFSANMRVFPTDVDTKTKERILERNKAIVEGFGLKQGITHSEFIMDEDGEIYLLETAARGGGVHISSDLISIKTGLNTEKFLLDIAMGNIKELPKTEDRDLTCGYAAFYLPKGEVESIDGLSGLDKLPFVKNHICNTIYCGKKIGDNTDKTTRFSIIIEAKNREQFYAYRKQLIELLKIRVRTKDGYAYPIWE